MVEPRGVGSEILLGTKSSFLRFTYGPFLTPGKEFWGQNSDQEMCMHLVGVFPIHLIFRKLAPAEI